MYIHIYVHTRMHVCIYIYTHVYICAHLYCDYIHMSTHVYMYLFMCAHLHVCVYLGVYMYGVCCVSLPYDVVAVIGTMSFRLIHVCMLHVIDPN